MADSLLVVGDRPTFRVIVRDSVTSQVVNLTGSTVKFRFKINIAVTIEQSATITDGPNGKAEYGVGVGELSAAGNIYYEWLVIDAGAKAFHQNRIPFQKAIRAVL